MKSEPNDLIKAIRTLRPDAEFSFSDGDYSTITWDKLQGEAPTEKEIDAAIKAVKIEESKKAEEIILKRQEILDKLGITEEEAELLLL